jgi:hypothetical protein
MTRPAAAGAASRGRNQADAGPDSSPAQLQLRERLCTRTREPLRAAQCADERASALKTAPRART